jgi:chemotaxis response regulator CheB
MGVQAVNRMGGTVMAQDEKSSEFFGMGQPEGAILPMDEVTP